MALALMELMSRRHVGRSILPLMSSTIIISAENLPQLTLMAALEGTFSIIPYLATKKFEAHSDEQFPVLATHRVTVTFNLNMGNHGLDRSTVLPPQ